MPVRVQFMKEVAWKGLVPVRRWSRQMLDKLPPDMAKYLSTLRRANKYNPKETVVRLHMGEFDNNLFIAANSSNERLHVCNWIEQGRNDLPFTLDGLKSAINKNSTRFLMG